MIHLSPLQLKNFFIEQLDFRALAGDRGTDKVGLHMAMEYDVRQPRDSNGEFRAHLLLKVSPDSKEKGPGAPEVLMRIVGDFVVATGVDEKVRRNLIAISAPSILYGIARGILSLVSSKSVRGQLLLPTVDSRDFASRKEHIPALPARSPRAKEQVSTVAESAKQKARPATKRKK